MNVSNGDAVVVVVDDDDMIFGWDVQYLFPCCVYVLCGLTSKTCVFVLCLRLGCGFHVCVCVCVFLLLSSRCWDFVRHNNTCCVFECIVLFFLLVSEGQEFGQLRIDANELKPKATAAV